MQFVPYRGRAGLGKLTRSARVLIADLDYFAELAGEARVKVSRTGVAR